MMNLINKNIVSISKIFIENVNNGKTLGPFPIQTTIYAKSANDKDSVSKINNKTKQILFSIFYMKIGVIFDEKIIKKFYTI
jgi:hypothetical protein